MIKNYLPITALFALISFQTAAHSQEFVSNSRSNTTLGIDGFNASLDAAGPMMSRLYDERLSHFHQGYSAQAVANLMNNQTSQEMMYRQTASSQMMSKMGTDQSAYNQGNNQANNGYMAGGFPNGVGLPLFESSLFSPNNPLNTGINRNFINTGSSSRLFPGSLF